MVKAIPDNYHSVTPYIMFHDAAGAIEFYKRAFGAQEMVRMRGEKGRIMHAELRMGDSMIMLADEAPQMNAYSPQHYGGSPVSFMFYVDDVDAVAEQAMAAGATIERPIQNQFYGDRSGTFVDPYGYKWTIGTHVEDVSPEEMKRRMAAMVPA